MILYKFNIKYDEPLKSTHMDGEFVYVVAHTLDQAVRLMNQRSSNSLRGKYYFNDVHVVAETEDLKTKMFHDVLVVEEK